MDIMEDMSKICKESKDLMNLQNFKIHKTFSSILRKHHSNQFNFDKCGLWHVRLKFWKPPLHIQTEGMWSIPKGLLLEWLVGLGNCLRTLGKKDFGSCIKTKSGSSV